MGIKFDQIVETVIGRFNAGGYLPGMYVKFRPNYKSCDCYKSMPKDMKAALDELIKSGWKIKVAQVGDSLSGHSAGNNFKTADKAVITVVGDQGGGRSLGSITVTPDMIDIDEEDFKIPDDYVKDYTEPFEAEEFFPDEKHPTRLTDKGNGKLGPTNIKLAESNESSSTKTFNDLVNLVESATTNYEHIYEQVLNEGFLRRIATKFSGGGSGNPLKDENKMHQFAKSVAFDVGKDIAKSFGGDYASHAKTIFSIIKNYLQSVKP